MSRPAWQAKDEDQTVISLKRVGRGRYEFAHYLIEDSFSGWRWSNGCDPSSGGEWRSTRREATLDLMAHLGMTVGVRPIRQRRKPERPEPKEK